MVRELHRRGARHGRLDPRVDGPGALDPNCRCDGLHAVDDLEPAVGVPQYGGAGDRPSVADLFVFALLVPGLFIIPASIRGRLSRAEKAAVYIDSALVFCLLFTVLALIHGPAALALPSASWAIALAYPTAFIGLAGAGLVSLIAARYPLAPRGALALIAGSATIGIAYLGWVAPTAKGDQAGELSSVLFTVGTLVAAFGV